MRQFLQLLEDVGIVMVAVLIPMLAIVAAVAHRGI